jgi:beta-lactamase superfamily II metal-dependent hydrolase/PKD repeat protein
LKRPALALAAVAGLAAAASAQELRIYHLDVEQGDATLVVSPDGRALLFDGGPNGAGTNRVIPRLETLGVLSLDYTVASHYDADHIGGLDEVMNAGYLPAVAAYDRGPNTTKTTQSYFDYVEATGDRRRTIEPGEVIALGALVTLECVAVNGVTSLGASAGLTADDENDSSVALLLRYGDFEYLVAGDLTGGGLGTHDIEGMIAPIARDVDALRVCHHGSATSSSLGLVERIRPDVALITCGTSNAYGHPDQGVLDRLTAEDDCVAIWCTNPGSGSVSPKLVIVGSSNAVDGEILLATSGVGEYAVNGLAYPIVVDAAPPEITGGPTAGDIGASVATISWTTSEETEPRVEYGPTAAYGSVVAGTALATSHARTLGGLLPETTYHYRVGAIDASGNGPVWSADATFTTLAAGAAGVVVNEVCGYGGGLDEWVEIVNMGAAAADLSGWTLTDNDTHDFVFPAGFVLPGGAYVVITSSSSGADDADASDGLATFHGALPGRFGATNVWNQGGDDVHLLDAALVTVDYLAYGSGTGIDPAPSGHWTNDVSNPAAPSSIAQSVARYPNGTDSNRASDWRGPGETSSGVSNGGEPTPPPEPPLAEAGPAAIGAEGDALAFSGAASAAQTGASIVSYAWDFGDGNTGNGAEVTHAYADDGSYQVTLTVTDSNGLTAVDGTTAEVENAAPSASAGGPYGGIVGESVALAGTGGDPGAADVPTLAYAWDFGDGTGATGASATHAYAAAGTYVATLTVTDDDGASAQSSATVTVTEPPPSTAAPLVVSARNNATGTEYGSASQPVAELNTAGDGGKVVVNPGASAWWEARFDAVGAVSSVESASATVSYSMVSGKWNGTLTLELRDGTTLLASRTLAKSTSLATVTWDVSAYVTPANASALRLRLVNVDPRGTKVRWAQAAASVTYR